MTLITRIHTQEGIVLAADSRSTFVYDDGRASDWQDRTQKVYLVGRNVGIAFSGFTHSDALGIHLPTTLQEFAGRYEERQLYDPGEIRAQLAEFVERQVGLNRLSKEEHEAMFLVTGYGGNGAVARKTILFSSHERYFVWHNDQPDVLLMGDAEGYEVFERYQDSARPDLRTVEQAVTFVNVAYGVVASRTDRVGGPVDVLVLRPDGAEWRQRKA
ncbi:MAG: hypothetical protein ACXVO1_07345 [Tumebacillaceae bacterium]